MIGRLTGRVVAMATEELILEVGGVGYRVAATGRTLARLRLQETASLHIETQMSESAIRLYGFLTDADRAWFVRLQDAPGVGAKAALAMIEALDASGVADAIAAGDVTALTRAHGVGKRLAERVVTELRGKPAPVGFQGVASAPGEAAVEDAPAASGDGAPAPTATPTALRAEAVSALVNLGYGHPEAQRAVALAARLQGAGANVGSLIRAALKELSA
jgi:Holliday junction DNA helicase RuvA